MNDKTKNNIMIVAANGLGRSGVPNVIYQVAKCLSEYVNIDIVVFNDDDFYYDKIKKIGANIIKVDLKEPVGKYNRLLWRMLREKRDTIHVFSKLLKRKEYIAIHSFREVDSAYIFVAAERCGVKTRTIHCNNEIKQTSNLISKYFYSRKMKVIYDLTTKLIGVSSTCCNISYPNIAFDVLYNSYDEDKYNGIVPCVLSDNELMLTHIGTFSERKNQLFSIDLVNELRKYIPFVKVNIIGVEAEQGYLEKMKRKINELNLFDFVNIFDGSRDFSDLLPRTSYIILPSLREAAPIVLVEAQASGIMCFVSKTVTRDIDCGGVKYLDTNSVNEWVDAVCSYFHKNKNSRCSYDVSKFSSSIFHHKLLDIYSDVI